MISTSKETEHIARRDGAMIMARHHTIRLTTTACMQFIDVTDLVLEHIRNDGVKNGMVNVQTMHTTTAIIVNENEPLLVEDMKRTIERTAPRSLPYQHDDFTIRTKNLEADECQNGHSHCQALFLNTSATLNIVDGKIQLGKWQRIFFIELDRPKERTISLMVFGQ
jgi:secondary thiamine-phosphate synthase enzyme